MNIFSKQERNKAWDDKDLCDDLFSVDQEKNLFSEIEGEEENVEEGDRKSGVSNIV